MRIVIDDLITDELKTYLLSQDGIDEVNIFRKDFLGTVDVKYNEKITPCIIMKHIELFQKNKFPIVFAFNKGQYQDIKELKYTIDDMCCEYCYKGLVKDLFDNEYINAVKSNFKYDEPAFNIEFIIEYDNSYSEDDLIKYIKDKYR